MAHHPRFGIEYPCPIRNNQHVAIQFEGPHPLATTSRLTVHSPSAGHRCINPMVALQTSFTSVSLESTLVAQPKSPKDSQKTAPMAFTGLGSPSTMPRTVVQDHLCQTSFRAGPTLQPQAGCYNMVDNSPSRMLVQELARLQNSSAQSQ